MAAENMTFEKILWQIQRGFSWEGGGVISMWNFRENYTCRSNRAVEAFHFHVEFQDKQIKLSSTAAENSNLWMALILNSGSASEKC